MASIDIGIRRVERDGGGNNRKTTAFHADG
jgi:hypothetical protein